MTEVVTPDVWRTIVARAVTDAQAGDVEARKWLTKYLLGENPPSLLSLAAADARGVNSEREIDETARAQETETALNAQSQRILERMAGKS
jgi:plasmid stability protein